jgi:DNA-binding transcriptional regulator GbsR (MarR family)
MQNFILHWGEMGTKWGTNRTVSQIFALLYLSEKPLNADEISETLSVARSNVSTSIRELQSWGILKTVQELGDRKDYYTTLEDIWILFQTILAERKKREVDPTLSVVRQCMMDSEAESGAKSHATQQLSDVNEFFELAITWYEQMNRFSPGQARQMMKMGDKVVSLVGKKKK